MSDASDLGAGQLPDDVTDQIADAVVDRLDDTPDVEDKTPAEVWDSYSSHYVENGHSENGLQSVRSAWSQFTDWMELQGYDYLSDLTASFPAKHDDWIVSNPEISKNKLSRAMHLTRIKQVITHAKSRGWIAPDDVPTDDRWDDVTPSVDKDDKLRSDPLLPERGTEVMNYVRNEHFGEREHVLWILEWKYALRLSAIRALDVEDLILEEPDSWPEHADFPGPCLNLKDRPDIGLTLKNTRNELSDRFVPLKREDAVVLQHYVESERIEHDETDDHELRGLLTTEHNVRITGRTIRAETKKLTSPETYADQCDCDGCRAYRNEHGRPPYPSKLGRYCERSRSPHQVRHGAITWLLDDTDPSVLSKICGTSPDTLRDTYDRADKHRRLNRIADAW